MRIASLLLLMALPGSWLAFCPGSAHLSYGARFALAVVLSPLVAAIQFYALRVVSLSAVQKYNTVKRLDSPTVSVPSFTGHGEAWRWGNSESSPTCHVGLFCLFWSI